MSISNILKARETVINQGELQLHLREAELAPANLYPGTIVFTATHLDGSDMRRRPFLMTKAKLHQIDFGIYSGKNPSIHKWFEAKILSHFTQALHDNNHQVSIRPKDETDITFSGQFCRDPEMFVCELTSCTLSDMQFIPGVCPIALHWSEILRNDQKLCKEVAKLFKTTM